MGFIFVSDSGQQMIVELTMTAVATKKSLSIKIKTQLRLMSCHDQAWSPSLPPWCFFNGGSGGGAFIA